MRKLFFCLFLFINCSISLFAQQNHFVYIQTENNQPFYVKLNKKLYSSSASGYLILPKLLDGGYDFQIGFPENKWPEQNLTCSIDKKDVGYLLKNFGDKGWGLFDLQTLNITMAKAKEKKEEVKMEEKNDAFSNMLSDVVNDPTIKQKEVVKEEIKKEEPVKTVVQEPIIEPTKPVEPIMRSSITKSMMSNTKDGTEMIYIDVNNGNKDTIRVFIPADKQVSKEVKPVKEEINQQPLKEEVKKEEPKAVKVKEEKVKETKFIDFDQPVQTKEEPKKEKKKKKKEEENIVKEETIVPLPASKTADAITENANCKGFATDEEFLKLRKKMAAGDDDDDMINSARKTFKTKCFTTDQVKNLSVLFLNDEGKYKFFDAAYSFISDPKNFADLQNQLTDQYYKSRFKAMLRK